MGNKVAAISMLAISRLATPSRVVVTPRCPTLSQTDDFRRRCLPLLRPLGVLATGALQPT